MNTEFIERITEYRDLLDFDLELWFKHEILPCKVVIRTDIREGIYTFHCLRGAFEYCNTNGENVVYSDITHIMEILDDYLTNTIEREENIVKSRLLDHIKHGVYLKIKIRTEIIIPFKRPEESYEFKKCSLVTKDEWQDEVLDFMSDVEYMINKNRYKRTKVAAPL